MKYLLPGLWNTYFRCSYLGFLSACRGIHSYGWGGRVGKRGGGDLHGLENISISHNWFDSCSGRVWGRNRRDRFAGN